MKRGPQLLRKSLSFLIVLSLVITSSIGLLHAGSDTMGAIQEFILNLTSLDDNARAEIVDKVIMKVSTTDYTEKGYRDILNKYMHGISNDRLQDALKEIAKLSQPQRLKIQFFVLLFELKDVGSRADKFPRIRNIINELVTDSTSDNRGISLVVSLLGYLNTTGDNGNFSIVYDGVPVKTKILFKIEGHDYSKDLFDSAVKYIGALQNKGINDVTGLLKKLTDIINTCPDDQIFEFKKYLDTEYKGVYSGTLPKPDSNTPVPTTSAAPTPTPTTKPDDGGSGGGGSGGRPSTPDTTSAKTAAPTVAPTLSPTVKPTVNQPESTELPAVPSFKDLKDGWAKDLINSLVKKGIINGYQDNTIRPENLITRAESVTTIVKALKLAADSELKSKFNDNIPEWAIGYIQAALEKGIVKGYTDNTFRAGTAITRKEAAVMLMRAFEFGENKDADVSFKDILT